MQKRVSQEVFDYGKFEKDLKEKLERESMTFSDASLRVMRGRNYLSNAFKRQNMSSVALEAVCNVFHMDPNRYKVYELQQEFDLTEKNDWALDTTINLEKQIVTVEIRKGDKIISRGKGRILGDTDFRVVQAISYATHMCYKFVQQKMMEE